MILLRISARRRASDRVSLITAASPTERTIQSQLPGTTPSTSHGCVFNAHQGLVRILPARDRINRRIVAIPNYSRGQTTERPYLNKGLLGHEPLKRFVPFWDNRAVYYHQASLDPILLSAIKKPTTFRVQYGSSI